MKYLLLYFLIISCNQIKPVEVQVNECVIGTRMDVWKLLRKEKNKYLFVTYPFGEGAPVEIVEDVSAFKKVECPQ